MSAAVAGVGLCRLLVFLWPDSCDTYCPAAFKEAARALLTYIPCCRPRVQAQAARSFKLRYCASIADFATNWHLATHSDYLRVAHALVKGVYGKEALLAAGIRSHGAVQSY